MLTAHNSSYKLFSHGWALGEVLVPNSFKINMLPSKFLFFLCPLHLKLYFCPDHRSNIRKPNMASANMNHVNSMSIKTIKAGN